MGDFRLSAAITLSGNNYRKIALLHRFAQIGMISASSFHRLSGHAIHPGVINYWEVRRLSKLEHFKGRDVILAGTCSFLVIIKCPCNYTQLLEYYSTFR